MGYDWKNDKFMTSPQAFHADNAYYFLIFVHKASYFCRGKTPKILMEGAINIQIHWREKKDFFPFIIFCFSFPFPLKHWCWPPVNAGNPTEDSISVQMASVKPMTPNVSYAILVLILSWRESESDGYENRTTPLSDTQLNLCNKVKKVSNKFYSKISVPQHSSNSHIIEALQCRSDEHHRSGAAWHWSNFSTCGRWPDH